MRKLPSGRLQASYLNDAGIRVTAPTTFETRIDADAWLHRQKEAMDRGDHRDPKAGRETFKAYAERWLLETKMTPRTRADYRRHLDRFLIPTFGAQSLVSITPAQVKTWHATLCPGKPSMRSHVYGTLRTITLAAVNDSKLQSSPCRIKSAGKSKRARKIKPATVPELDVMVEAMPERLRAMVLIAAWCGLRYGELAELRRGDLDLLHALVKVTRGVTRTKGQWHVGPPKTEAGIRDVDIPPFLVPILEAHLTEHVGPAADALMFPGALGGYLSPSSLYDHWYPARAAAGRKDLSFHGLRHTGATFAALAGATIADNMARMGHATPAAAMLYQHAVGDDRGAAIAAMLSEFHAAKATPLRPRARA